MGEVQVPAKAYYGASTQRAVLNFPISGQPFPRRFIKALGLVKRSAAEVNRELKLLDAKRARAKDSHLYVVVNIGIDQEGTLIGVSALKQADTDEVLNRCIMDSLQGVPWPKSHAGVITVKQEFKDKPIQAE